MKKLLSVVSLLMCVAAVLSAGETRTYPSGRYEFICPATFAGIEEVAEACNSIRSSFNEVFRFDPDLPGTPSRVVILADKAEFDAYITERIGEPRNQFLFLKYSRPELSELVVYPQYGTGGFASIAGPVLNRQLFLQYLYGYVSEPPVWIRDGFQAWFEGLAWDKTARKVTRDANSAWLETAKNLYSDTQRRLDATAILSAVTGSYDSVRLYPQAWAFVAFLMNTEKPAYQRFIHETCLLLEGTEPYNRRSQKENTDIVMDRFVRFNSPVKADEDLAFWLSGQYTFNELLQFGVSLYNTAEYASARKRLAEAAVIRPEDPMLAYYLGLVAYALKEFPVAKDWYLKSLKYGAETATVNWALGLNALADKQYAESRTYLETAKTANPVKYTEKADKLISSMPK
jgi:Protein of unknown function (DUF1570).